MSFCMEIVRCNLSRTTSKSIDEIDDMYIAWDWDEGNDKVKPDETIFKWDDEFTNDLVKLAKIGVVGEVVTRGDEELAKYILEDEKVKEYYGKVVFPDEPNETHTEIKTVAISVLENVEVTA